MTLIITKSFALTDQISNELQVFLNIFDVIASAGYGYYLSNELKANKEAIKEVTRSFDQIILHYKGKIDGLSTTVSTVVIHQERDGKEVDPQFVHGANMVMKYFKETMSSSMYTVADLIENLGGENSDFIEEREEKFLTMYGRAGEILKSIGYSNGKLDDLFSPPSDDYGFHNVKEKRIESQEKVKDE